MQLFLFMFLISVIKLIFAIPSLYTSVSTPSNPVANSGSIVHCDAYSRFTILTHRVVRAEYIQNSSLGFEDRASFAFINRQLPILPFTVHNNTNWCNITLMNEHENSGGIMIISYNKQQVNTDSCLNIAKKTDVVCNGKCQRVSSHPNGLKNQTQMRCCKACNTDSECASWVFATDVQNSYNCWLLQQGTVIDTKHSDSRIFGQKDNNSNPFVAHQLQMQGKMGFSSAKWVWHANDSPGRNLMGTIKATPSADLANCCHNPDPIHGLYDPKYPLENGLLSRDGWAIINDVHTRLIDSDGWIVPKSQGRRPHDLDLYVFGCGYEYKQCLKDFVQIAGPISLPPFAAFGVWWSRHWGDSYDNNPFGPMTKEAIMSTVVDGYDQHDLPLHVVVLDMEWHSMLDPGSCTKFIGKKGWGGYTWNHTLFPNPNQFVKQLHDRGIKLSLNFHPDRGIDVCQDIYKSMALAIGVDPKSRQKLGDLNQNSENQTYVKAYFDIVIPSTITDYSWTDSPQVSAWSNSLYDKAMVDLDKRPLVLSRYGGLGNHRSPIGFSGDTLRRWDTLAYEVWMTQRASNIGFGYWSHDIGGFSGGEIDPKHHTEPPELFLRWLQFAIFAPIFRTHCRYCEQRIWTFETDFYLPMKQTMLARNQLLPYIYTHAYMTELTGVSIVHPCYYEYPSYSETYSIEFNQQYMFGNDILVAPITEAVDNITNNSRKSVWLPPGQWVDWRDSSVKKGDTIFNSSYTMEKIPLFVRAGAIIPTRTNLSAEATFTNPLMWLVIPGAYNGTGSVYEDDGESMSYKKGSGAITTANFMAKSGTLNNVFINISATIGSFEKIHVQRFYRVGLVGRTSTPRSVKCNDVTIEPTSHKVPGFWFQDGQTVLTGTSTKLLLIACPEMKITQTLIIRVSDD